MLRQRPADWLAAFERWHRNLLGCHLRRGLGLRRVLLRSASCSSSWSSKAPRSEDCPNCSCRSFLIASLSFSISSPHLGLRFRGQAGHSLGAQHRLQGGHIVGERIIGAHRRLENHETPALSELPVLGPSVRVKRLQARQTGPLRTPPKFSFGQALPTRSLGQALVVPLLAVVSMAAGGSPTHPFDGTQEAPEVRKNYFVLEELCCLKRTILAPDRPGIEA